MMLEIVGGVNPHSILEVVGGMSITLNGLLLCDTSFCKIKNK